METNSSSTKEKSLQLNSDPTALDRPRALVIDGPSLITAMADPAIRSALLEFSTRCRAVVACRVSPDQKRSLVQLIKTGKGVCLVIFLLMYFI